MLNDRIEHGRRNEGITDPLALQHVKEALRIERLNHDIASADRPIGREHEAGCVR